jgi:hypothetical protein
MNRVAAVYSIEDFELIAEVAEHATQGVGVHAPRQSSTLVIVAACRLSRILRHSDVT